MLLSFTVKAWNTSSARVGEQGCPSWKVRGMTAAGDSNLNGCGFGDVEIRVVRCQRGLWAFVVPIFQKTAPARSFCFAGVLDREMVVSRVPCFRVREP